MIDVLTEEIIDFAQAAKIPVLRNRKSNKPCHIAQIYRYVQSGARAVNGERIKLEVVKHPSGMMTSVQAIGRFIERLTNPEIPPNKPTPSQRRRQIDVARQRLVACGM